MGLVRLCLAHQALRHALPPEAVRVRVRGRLRVRVRATNPLRHALPPDAKRETEREMNQTTGTAKPHVDSPRPSGRPPTTTSYHNYRAA